MLSAVLSLSFNPHMAVLSVLSVEGCFILKMSFEGSFVL